MFCPNCGTKNEEAAQRCRQCGLELAEKKAAPKFKGTMMMGNSPFAGMQPGGAPAPGAAGAAPGTPAPGAAASGAPAPGTPAATPSAAPQAGAPQASRAALKGTMVGVAPPSLGAAAPPAAPAQAAAPAAGAKPMLKGTMIGVAPQGFGVPAGGAAAGGAPGAPAGGSVPPAGTASAAPPAEAAKVAPKLKGTMIGVAPQGFNPADLAAKAAAATPSAAPAAPAGVDLGKTEPPPPMDGSYGATEAFAAVPAAPQAPAQDEVNPLGGTMLGMAAPDFGAPPAAADAAAYGLGATQPNPAYVPPERQQPAYEEPSTGVPSAAARLGSPGANEAITTTAGVHGPIGKDRNPVVTFLLSMVCFVYALIALVQMLGELRAFRQKNDISILLFFIPIINIIEVWKLPAKVADAQRMAGIQNPQVAHPVLYLFFGIYFLPADLNETWSAARRNIG